MPRLKRGASGAGQKPRDKRQKHINSRTDRSTIPFADIVIPWSPLVEPIIISAKKAIDPRQERKINRRRTIANHEASRLRDDLRVGW